MFHWWWLAIAYAAGCVSVPALFLGWFWVCSPLDETDE